jgi:probable phosphoglycerate mutase
MSAEMTLSVEIFIHLDAVGRDFKGPDDARPLTDLGSKQAERIAQELGGEPVTAVYASSNTRCRQSIEPLAKRYGLTIGDLPMFKDVHDLRGQGRDPNGPGPNPVASAYLAGSAASELERIRKTVPEGRVVICANGGDIVPALMAYLAGTRGSPVPGRLKSLRGGVYKAVFDGDQVTISEREASSDFPE